MAVVTARPYQRRRRGPIVVVVAVLAAIAVGTWSVVLLNSPSAGGSTSCPTPASGTPGEVLAYDALDSTQPVAPGAVRVKVLNGGGQRGQATLVAAQLGDNGFAEAEPPATDTFFPDGDMACTGQLRFGPAGEAAAGTAALVLPCLELVRDGRQDDSVDVVLGTGFGDLNPSKAARDVLEQLGSPSGGSDGSANADPSAADQAPPPTPAIDAAALAEARSHCS